MERHSQFWNSDANINKKVYQDITEEEEIYAYKQKIARDLLKLQADYFYKKQQKML